MRRRSQERGRGRAGTGESRRSIDSVFFNVLYLSVYMTWTRGARERIKRLEKETEMIGKSKCGETYISPRSQDPSIHISLLKEKKY